MINIPGNRPVRRPVENNRVKQKERIEASDKTATEKKPAQGPVPVERRRNPDRRQSQSPTSVELRSRRDRRRASRIDIDV
ncbi:MAG: hypothetical protein ACR2P1_25140 [Pseudomonadales bacterium]